MEFAEVAYASDETIAKAERRNKAPENLWANVKPGMTVLIGKPAKRFRVSSVDPTREGGAFAWLRGRYVTAQGKPSPSQISHLHLPEGQRQEFVHIDQVRIFV